MNIRPMDMPWPVTTEGWTTVRALGINLVRLWVDTAQASKTVAEQIPHIDTAVSIAETQNMYVLLGNGGPPGTYDKASVLDFWTQVAPRYASKTHVFYEMANEPTRGNPFWGSAPQMTDAVLRNLRDVYAVMRSGAPDTHIVLFTPANLHPTPSAWRTVVQRFEALVEVDWTKASVGYHHYTGTEEFGGLHGMTGIAEFRAWYPLLMTETNYWNVPELPYTLRDYERDQISWISLAGKSASSCSSRLAVVVADLHAQGYDWAPE